MSNEAPKSAPSSALYAEGRGTGGKLRKPPARKPPSTPYDRPRNQQQRENSGWFSKIVHPAYRLIAGGATRLLPSLFPPSSTSDDLSSLPPLEPVDSDEGQPKVNEETINDNQEMVKNISKVEKEKAFGSTELTEHGRGKTQNLSDDDGLSKIEQLIKGKKFSRDDMTRLMEILQSKTLDFEQETKDPDVKPTVKVNMVEISPGKTRELNEERPEESGRVMVGSSKPQHQPTIEETISTSPVEIAKAYMDSRTIDRSFTSEGFPHKGMLSSLRKDDFAGIPSVPSRSPTESTCWPGAIIQESPGYSTPHSQGGRSTLRGFSRTPYSRTFFSKPKSKLTALQGESVKLLNNSSTPTPFWRAQTPIFGQLKPDASEHRYGSAGPIRRMRNKFIPQSPTNVSPSVRSFQESPLRVNESSDYTGFFSKKTFEPGATSSFTFDSLDDKAHNSDVEPVHPHNSKLARQILEQISKLPSQKEKLEELKLGRKTSTLSEPMSAEPDKQINLSHFAGLSHRNEGQENVFFKVKHRDIKSNDVTGTVKDGASTPVTFLRSASARCDDNTATSITSLSANGFESKSSYEVTEKDAGEVVRSVSSFSNKSNEQGVATKLPTCTAPATVNMQKRPLPSRTKPDLPSISINRTSAQSVIASDNNAGFSFPRTNSSSLPEPPTPSILPSSTSSSLLLNNSFISPTYSFGNKKSYPPLVFSFPSTSTAATPNNTANIKFKFGSDEERISFRFTRKDPVYC